jgi:hypothetical protein
MHDAPATSNSNSPNYLGEDTLVDDFYLGVFFLIFFVISLVLTLHLIFPDVKIHLKQT